MLGEIIADLSNWMYTYLLVILLVAAGLFFTIRNRFPQLRLLREAIRVVVERPEKVGSVSSFQALMVSTASRVPPNASLNCSWDSPARLRKVAIFSDNGIKKARPFG